MQLVLDIGNSRCKAALFDKEALVSAWEQTLQEGLPAAVLQRSITHVVVASVGHKNASEILATPMFLSLSSLAPQFIEIGKGIKLPFKNHYATPETLGIDRLAGIAALVSGATNAQLRIDFGTCLTFDLWDPDQGYLGGAISLGFRMRLKALHQFTAKLPEIDPIDAVNTYLKVVIGKKIVGQTTLECMVTGVIGGLIAETETYVRAITGQYNKVTITICGGDAPTFASLLGFEAKLADNLVLMGLNQLFLFNQDA